MCWRSHIAATAPALARAKLPPVYWGCSVLQRSDLPELLREHGRLSASGTRDRPMRKRSIPSTCKKGMSGDYDREGLLRCLVIGYTFEFCAEKCLPAIIKKRLRTIRL